MVKKKETDGQYVKKETLLVVAFVTLIAGFLGGVVFSAYRSGPGLNVPASGLSDQASQTQNISNKLAQEILSAHFQPGDTIVVDKEGDELVFHKKGSVNVSAA